MLRIISFKYSTHIHYSNKYKCDIFIYFFIIIALNCTVYNTTVYGTFFFIPQALIQYSYNLSQGAHIFIDKYHQSFSKHIEYSECAFRDFFHFYLIF